MHVSGDGGSDQHVQNLAKSFMTTLGIDDNDPEHAVQLERLTQQLSGMVMNSQSSNQQPTVHKNQTSTTTNSSAPTAAAPPLQSTTTTQSSPKSRRDRVPRHPGRSRSPMARFTRAAAKGLRSLSPRRRTQNERPPRSPLAKQSDAMEADDDEEFFDTMQSPTPKQPQQPNGDDSNRPPLATVNVKNSPIPMSGFKFDKEHDKFNVGSSPPKKSKFGSPSKKRSPTKSSPPQTSPLQGSPLSDASPFMPNIKVQTKGVTPLFASPVPETFHDPTTFINHSGSRGIPTPQNILQNDEATRRQTAPATMGAAASAATASFSMPKTPLDAEVNKATDTPDTDESLIKKKTRNTATPNLGSPHFQVDLSQNPNKAKGKRGNTLRKSFNNSKTFSSTTTGASSFTFGGLDEIKESGTDDTAPTTAESPSNGSAVFMDTSPILSPPPPKSQTAGGFRAPPGGFSLGVGDAQPGKNRGGKKNKRRSQQSRSQSAANVFGPSSSTFDLNHNAQQQAQQQQQQQQMQKEAQLGSLRADITRLKDHGKACYMAAKYQQSTTVYSEAIEKFKLQLFAHVPCKDLLAVLLSNRAAALLMIGAYENAAEDCRNGIHYVTDPRNTNIATCPDANPSLRPKLYTRMGRAYIKLGKVDEADRAFSEAIESAAAIQDFLKRQNIAGTFNDALEQIKTEAVLGQSDAFQLRKTFDKIQGLEGQQSAHPRNNRDRTMECLGLIKVALNTANGCYELHLAKVKLLAEMHRWREILNHCERFAASNVKFDGCLIGDLSSKNPFPGVSVAKYLRANFFGDTREDEVKGAEMVLDKKSACEALLRLPIAMMPYYLRSLRLNEKYVIAEACIKSLDKHITAVGGATFVSQFLWLREEREKLRRTKTEREIADTMFTNAEYRQAAQRYSECLAIDSGSLHNASGCRLHAILHCNRAACFMAVRKHRDAMNECTAALRIYPRYLKALLRRARCYNRMERTREAISDYNHWLEIVKLGREGKSNPVLGDCVFDGPHTIADKDIKDVQAELKDVLDAKARAVADEKARQARNSYQEESRKYQSERFDYKDTRSNYQEESKKYQSERFQYNGAKSPAHEEARKRRENFYSSQNTSRRWDSFKDRTTQSSRQEQPKAQKNRKDEYGYKSSSGGYKSENRSQGSPRDVNDHYSALGIDRRATAEEVKKAYKKMALKYHPDKNKDNPTAADNFLRIKDAYETLKDPNARRKYDAKSRRRRY